MSEFIACSAAVFVFAALWLAVYKLGAMDWNADPSLAGATRELSAPHLVLDGEMHGAAARLSTRAARASAGRRSDALFSILAHQTRLAVPV